MSLASHANVYNTCLHILRQRGFALRLDYGSEGEEPYESPLWIAAKDGFVFKADNPIELLGLSVIFEFVKPLKDEPYWWSVDGPDIWAELRGDSHGHADNMNKP